MSQWFELKDAYVKGGSVGQDRRFRPNFVSSTCHSCGSLQVFRIAKAQIDKGTLVASSEAECLGCHESNLFVLTYPENPVSTGHIYPKRYFQLRDCSELASQVRLVELERKIRDRFSKEDFAGVASACYTFIETFLKIELLRLSKLDGLENNGDIKKLFSALRDNTALDPSGHHNSVLRPFLSSLAGQINGVYELANKLSDRHESKAPLHEAEARLVMETTFSLCSYVHKAL